ncbi:phospholipase A2 inhibitor beta [Anabrus simplex]|uniref:phospholipase A2 inhibitor beta n=1 Tax=Anabrus simplex TaxID=316456 RepID=UPI0035A29714
MHVAGLIIISTIVSCCSGTSRHHLSSSDLTDHGTWSPSLIYPEGNSHHARHLQSRDVMGKRKGLICPEGCRCGDSPSYIANCSNSGLTDIPERFPYQSTLIDLSFNRITYLKENLLGKSIIVHLSKIILGNNFIADIESKAFSYEARLTEVDLSNNNISRINSRIFKDNRLLVKLSLRGNRNLHLTHFGGFLQSDSLRELNISHCNIGRVPNNTFIHLPNIERIDLSHNNITALEPQSFAGLDYLNYLDISNNRLSSIMVDVLKSVLHVHQGTLKTEGQRNKRNAISSNLILFNNPWECKCPMKKVYDWCRRVGYDPGLICNTPDDMKNKQWEKLAEKQDCDEYENKNEEVDSRETKLVPFENYKEMFVDEHQIIQSASPVEILIIVASVLSILLSLNLMWMIHKDRRTGRNTIPFHIPPSEGNSVETHQLMAV